jgi:23S rRNA (guanine745-N1)-methyltransferase
VANLNNLPFSDNKFDIILNIMSPANYQEFKRVLQPGGILLKIMPDSDYLKELRRFIYQENDKNEYSNKDVLNNLAENINIKELIDVNYKHSVAAENITALFDMTPLTSNINEREQVRQSLIAQNKDFEITLAFKIAICEM